MENPTMWLDYNDWVQDTSRNLAAAERKGMEGNMPFDTPRDDERDHDEFAAWRLAGAEREGIPSGTLSTSLRDEAIVLRGNMQNPIQHFTDWFPDARRPNFEVGSNMNEFIKANYNLDIGQDPLSKALDQTTDFVRDRPTGRSDITKEDQKARYALHDTEMERVLRKKRPTRQAKEELPKSLALRQKLMEEHNVYSRVDTDTHGNNPGLYPLIPQTPPVQVRGGGGGNMTPIGGPIGGGGGGTTGGP